MLNSQTEQKSTWRFSDFTRPPSICSTRRRVSEFSNEDNSMEFPSLKWNWHSVGVESLSNSNSPSFFLFCFRHQRKPPSLSRFGVSQCFSYFLLKKKNFSDSHFFFLLDNASRESEDTWKCFFKLEMRKSEKSQRHRVVCLFLLEWWKTP